MSAKTIKSLLHSLVMIGHALVINSCFDKTKKSNSEESKTAIFPSDVIPFMDEWKIPKRPYSL